MSTNAFLLVEFKDGSLVALTAEQFMEMPAEVTEHVKNTTLVGGNAEGYSFAVPL